MGQLRVMLERFLILPFGVNGEMAGLTHGLEHAHRDATGFSARGLDHVQQVVTELGFPPG